MPACLEGKFETNRNNVQNNIRSGGWVVAFSNRELTETDATWGVITAVVSYFTGGTAFSIWLEELIRQSLAGMAESIENTFTPVAVQEAINFADNVITNLLQGKNSGEQFLDLFYVNFKAGVAQYIGQNFTWICNPFSSDGGFWQVDTQNQISYCPYVGMRLNPNIGSPTPSPPLKRIQWIESDGIWYNKHSSGEWHQFNGLQNPQFIRAFQETGRDKSFVYLESQPLIAGGKILQLALGVNRKFFHHLGGEPGWTPESSGHWKA